MWIAVLGFGPRPIPRSHGASTGEAMGGRARSNSGVLAAVASHCVGWSAGAVAKDTGNTLLMTTKVAVHTAHQSPCNAGGQN